MPNLPDVVVWSIPAFVLLTVIEMISVRIHPDEDAAGYEAKDAATSIGMGLGSLVFDFLWKIPIVAVYTAIYELTPLRVPVLLWTVPLMLLAQDFSGCRASRYLWTSESLIVPVRVLDSPWPPGGWLPDRHDLSNSPERSRGESPAWRGRELQQFWIHAGSNRHQQSASTPPAPSRAGGAAQGAYLDRNFGGILIVWDRLFGSFVAETDRPVYGLTKNINTFNPIKVATHEYVAIIKDVKAARSWRERAGRVFRGPGWAPARVPEPTEETVAA